MLALTSTSLLDIEGFPRTPSHDPSVDPLRWMLDRLRTMIPAILAAAITRPGHDSNSENSELLEGCRSRHSGIPIEQRKDTAWTNTRFT